MDEALAKQPAQRRLVAVEDDRFGDEGDAVAGLHQPIGEVDVLTAPEPRVEPAQLLEHFTARGPAHGDRIRRSVDLDRPAVVVDRLAEALDLVALRSGADRPS